MASGSGSPSSPKEAEKALSAGKKRAELEDRSYREILSKVRRNSEVQSPRAAAAAAAAAVTSFFESQAPTMRYCTVLSREEQMAFEAALERVMDHQGPNFFERLAQAAPGGLTAEQVKRRYHDLAHDVKLIKEGCILFHFSHQFGQEGKEDEKPESNAEENTDK